jgi:hypothetical protein
MTYSSDKRPSIDYLFECFNYNPSTGRLRWRKARPRSHFRSALCHNRYKNRVSKNTLAGKKQKHSPGLYVHLIGDITGLKKGRIPPQQVNAPVHVVAWAMYFKQWPEERILHINENPEDNRIVNLREGGYYKKLSASTELRNYLAEANAPMNPHVKEKYAYDVSKFWCNTRKKPEQQTDPDPEPFNIDDLI